MKFQLTALLRVSIADMLLVSEVGFPLSWAQGEILCAETPSKVLQALLSPANLALRHQYIQIFRLAYPSITVKGKRKNRSLQRHRRNPGLVERLQYFGKHLKVMQSLPPATIAASLEFKPYLLRYIHFWSPLEHCPT